jgi:hypothetical protein
MRLQRRAIDEDLALVRLVDAGEYLDEGRFSRAVLADERMNLAALDGQVDPVKRERADEALGQPADGNGRRERAIICCGS